MVSARSTVSIARTTPAQKPRGEQSTILRSGLADIGAIPADRITPRRRAGNGQFETRTWGRFRALSRHFHRPLRRYPLTAYIGLEFPSSLMTTGFASEKGGRSAKEICHEQ